MTRTEHTADLQESILTTLRYFALFSYPLPAQEVHRFLSKAASLEEVVVCLNQMQHDQRVFLSSASFYSIDDKPEWSERRIRGKNQAEVLLGKANKYVRKIMQFPFVKAIAISGSLSKYYADTDGDIDYFIVTEKNRLWISRTLLHLFKKTSFIRGNEHFYCMNYFVDETALEIDQKNLYSAIETVTLIPVFNASLISKLKEVNEYWIRDFLPNESYADDHRYVVNSKRNMLQRFAERMITLIGADKLNLMLMKATDNKWRKKWKHKSYPMDQYDQAFHTTIHVSKNHPANYQLQILTALKTDETTNLTKDFAACER